MIIFEIRFTEFECLAMISVKNFEETA